MNKLKSKLKLETKEIEEPKEEPKSSTVPTGKEDLPAIPAPSIPDADTSSNAASTIEEPKVETVAIEPKAKPKTINMDKTSGVTQVAEATTKGKSESYTEEQKKKEKIYFK